VAVQSLSGKCIANSVFLPGTQYHARESMAGAEDKLPKTSILDLLDYRCHTHNGHVRNNYPPSVRKCLGKINQMRVEDVRDAYGECGRRCGGWRSGTAIVKKQTLMY
jgi:hypothetical protein